MNKSESNTTSNSSDKGGYVYVFKAEFAYPMTAIYVIIIGTAIIGNILVCYAILTSPKLRRCASNIFIFSLALSDLLTATVAMPFDVDLLLKGGRWQHGEGLCQAWTVAYLVTVPTSILTLLSQSVDRYKTISDPLNRFCRSQFMTRTKALIVSGAVWLYSLIFALLPVLGWRKKERFVSYDMCYFPFEHVYSFLSSFINFVLPLLIACGIYIKIYFIASQQQKTKTGIRSCGSAVFTKNNCRHYQRNVRAAKTTCIFVCTFFFCWVPFSALSIVANLCAPCLRAIPPDVFSVLLMFGYTNSAINPFLFSFRDEKFKAAIVSCWRGGRRRGRGSSRQVTTRETFSRRDQ